LDVESFENRIIPTFIIKDIDGVGIEGKYPVITVIDAETRKLIPKTEMSLFYNTT
jgi:hypothetical protein